MYDYYFETASAARIGNILSKTPPIPVLQKVYIPSYFITFLIPGNRGAGEWRIGSHRRQTPALIRTAGTGGGKKLGANIGAIILIKVKKFPNFSREISRKFPRIMRAQCAPARAARAYMRRNLLSGANPRAGDAYISANDCRNDKRPRETRVCRNNFRCRPQI